MKSYAYDIKYTSGNVNEIYINDPLSDLAIQDVINKIGGKYSEITPNYLLEECLNQLGYINLDKVTEQNLVNNVSLKEFKNAEEITNAVSDTIRSVVSSREFQLA